MSFQSLSLSPLSLYLHVRVYPSLLLKRYLRGGIMFGGSLTGDFNIVIDVRENLKVVLLRDGWILNFVENLFMKKYIVKFYLSIYSEILLFRSLTRLQLIRLEHSLIDLKYVPSTKRLKIRVTSPSLAIKKKTYIFPIPLSPLFSFYFYVWVYSLILKKLFVRLK